MAPRVGAGLAALAAIVVLIGGAFAGMVSEAARDWSGAASAFDGYMLRVARFTLWQAGLSTLLSVVPALFVARAAGAPPTFSGPLDDPAPVRRAAGPAVARRGTGHPRALTDAPAISRSRGAIPWRAMAGHLRSVGHPGRPRLFQHAAGHAPVPCTRWKPYLRDQWRLSAQLGMNARATFRLLEWPVLRASLAGVAALVFNAVHHLLHDRPALGRRATRDHA